MSVPITLMCGTTFLYETAISICDDTPYGEFIGILWRVFNESPGKNPWKEIAQQIIPGNVFNPFFLAIYLYSSIFGTDHISMLQAIFAVPNDRLDSVLHRLIWHDWFAGTPIRELLPPGRGHRLNVTPELAKPWWVNKFILDMALFNNSISIGQPRKNVTYHTLINYMIREISAMMSAYENGGSMAGWLAAHRAYFLKKDPFTLPPDMVKVYPDSIPTIGRAAAKIAAKAGELCPAGSQW